MTTAVFSKVLLGSSVRNGSEWKKHDLQTRQTWCQGSGLGKESLGFSDSIRNEIEAKDKKVLRWSVPICPKESKKIIKRKITKEEMQLSDKCMKKYFNSLVVKDMVYKNSDL